MESTPQFYFDERVRKALKIIATPFLYKVCVGCESIVTKPSHGCPNCHGYRFLEEEEAVVAQAKVLATRPQQSVTPADLTK